MTGRTLDQLAKATRVRPDALEQLLAEDVKRGLLVRGLDGTYALSAEAERKFGAALRVLAGEERGR